MRARRTGIGLAAVGCAALAFACEPAFQSRVPDARLAGAVIAVLPIGRVAYTLDTFDARVEKELRANGMEGFMNPVLASLVTACGGHVIDDRQLEECVPCAQLAAWVAKAGMEIAAHKAGRGETQRRSVGDWVYSGDVTPVERAVDAKLALVVAFKDAREAPDGGAPGVVASVDDAKFKKVGVACFVDLVGGRIVWCESRQDTLDDLRSLGGARRAIDQLVRPMLSGINAGCTARVPPS